MKVKEVKVTKFYKDLPDIDTDFETDARDKVKEYLAILDTLDFTHCIGGHADIMTKEELYKSFEN